MTVHIIGGSNTLRRDGWTSYLAEHIEFENLAVGATSSAMGAYRTMFSNTLKAGDTLIWEYALNDTMHIRAGKSVRRMLLRFCEYTIRYCLENNITFIPLIFAQRAFEKLPNIGMYRKKLHELFSHYDIRYFDVSAEFRARNQVDRVPEECFLDFAHYDPTSEIIPFIVDQTLELLAENLPAPKNVQRVYVKQSRELSFFDVFETGQSEVFENSIYQSDAWGPDGTTLTMSKFANGGKISSVILLMPASGENATLTLRVGDRAIPLASTHKTKNFDRVLLAAHTFPNENAKIINFTRDDQISFVWDRSEKSKNPKAWLPDGALTEARIVGVLVEQNRRQPNR